MLVQTNQATTMPTMITQEPIEPKPMGIMSAIANKTIPKHTPAFATNNPYTLAEHKEFGKKLDVGEVTAQELKETFQKAVGSEGNIKAELKKLKVVDLKHLLRGSFYRNEKKDYLIEKVYQGMLMNFSISEVFSYQPFSETYQDAMHREVQKVTDEQIQERAKKILEHQKFLDKALTEPETKEEFQTFIRYRGEAKLSPEQKVKWDEIQAGGSLAKREQEIAQKAIVSKVNLGDIKLELVKHYHTHRKHDVFIVTMSERVDKEVYEELCKKARQLGGNYSKPWRDKATGSISPGGFMFNDEEQAQKFMQLKEADVSRLDEIKAHQEEVRENAVEHLKEMAENLTQEAIESQSVDRKVNTERRARFAAKAERESEHNFFLAKTLENIAQAISTNQTKYLSNTKAKTHIETLEYILSSAKWKKAKKESKRYEDIKDEDPMVDDIELAEYPYPTLHFRHLRDVSSIKQAKGTVLIVKRLTNLFNEKDKEKGYITVKYEHFIEQIKKLVSKIKPFDKYLAECISGRYAHYDRLQVMGLSNLPTLRTALREYLSYRGEQRKPDPIKEMERALIAIPINGYFPTPKAIVKQMLELAEIKDFMSVIEPSCGKGNIADEIRKNHPSANLSVIAKGHNLVGWDFLEHQGNYDRVLMNPPFESHQDIAHVKHAYSLLKPGGKVVAIMGEGAFFRMDKESVSFREWLEELGGISEKLPQGSFLDSERSTGVATRLVVMSKTPQQDKSLAEVVPDILVETIPDILVKELPKLVEGVSKEELAEKADEVLSTELNQNTADIVSPLAKDNNSEKVLSFDEYEEIKNSFLQHQKNYHQIKMNPVTYSWQDIENTYHAYYLLYPVGKLISTLSEETLSPLNKEANMFRKWVKSVGGKIEKIDSIEVKHIVTITKNTLF